MEILLLGPVRLRTQQLRPVELGSDKERLVLAALAVDPGRAVSVDALIARLWEGAAPLHARESVHSYVSRLRKRLATAGADGPASSDGRDGRDGPVISARAHTYMLRCDDDCVDWRRFQHLVSTRPVGDDRLAVETLVRAARLWNGEPLSGLQGAWADTTRRMMLEQRLRADVLRITAMLRQGQFATTLGELTALADQRAADETVQGLLMVAYHGSQRSAEALHVHQRLRQTLRVEYGTRPGQEIDRLHRGILDRIPAADLIRNTPSRGRAPVVDPAVQGSRFAPRNLPHQPPLIGRSGELRLLTGDHPVVPDATVITLETVTGMAGVGKTALAVHTADRLTTRYPDAQLYVNFRTHADQAPVTPGEAVATLLRLLGAAATQIPADIDGQTALWHHMLAERRVVMVLDDIADAAQVESVLPQSSTSLAIMTSRRHIAGIPHARRIRLDVLPTPDAVALFRRFAGEQRTGDLGLVRRVVDLVGHLPLAIELVASRFHTRPSWTLTHLAGHLSTPGRLAEIHDPKNSLERAFELSYRTLDHDQRRAFRLLGLHPGGDFTADAAAAMLDLPVIAAEGLIEALLVCHLISEPEPERFQYHDLLREYARSLTLSRDQDAADALRRLIAFYADSAGAADRHAYPRRLRPAGRPAGESGAVRFADASRAKAWLLSERQNLMAVFNGSANRGDPALTADLGYSLAGFLEAECHWQEAESVLRQTAAMWRIAGHERSHSMALLCLATVQANTSQYPASAENLSAVLTYAHAAGDDAVEAEALRVQGLRKWHEGEHEEALESYEPALALKAASGDVWGQAQLRNNIAVVYLHQGRHEEALTLFRTALRAFADEHDELSSARILNNIGDMHQRKGELRAAQQAFEDALAFLNRAGNRYDRATTRAGLADTFAEMGRSQEAVAIYRECLLEFQALGDHKSAAETLIALAQAHRSLGNLQDAARYQQDAIELATRIGAVHLLGLSDEEG